VSCPIEARGERLSVDGLQVPEDVALSQPVGPRGVLEDEDPGTVEGATYLLGAGRVVLTHDSDLGALVVRDGLPFLGIVYLRPGHIRPTFVLGMLDELARSEVDVRPPFVVVAERKHQRLRFRVRCEQG
jgi:hypothetical protein